jgi:hypothetical protein
VDFFADFENEFESDLHRASARMAGKGARQHGADDQARGGREETGGGVEVDNDSFIAFWHGDVAVENSRPWLIHGTMAEVGCGLLSGQWGTYKTFIAKDLAAAVMTGTPIFGSEIDRRGGVLFYAAESECEVAIRIQAAIENRWRDMTEPQFDPKRAPFAWLTTEKLPLCLLAPKNVEQLVKLARRVDAEMQARFSLPLTLIIVDTVVATAGYKKSGDENDPTIGTRVMTEGLAAIARQTRTFTLGIDHFGKDAETGTRGASSKEDNADTVLAALGTKDITGNVTNPRVVVRKVRGGVGGREYAFSTREVDMGVDPKDRKITTLVINWAKLQQEIKQNKQIDGWGKSDGMTTLRRCIMNVNFDLIDWDAIEDRTREVQFHPSWNRPADIIEAVAQQYREDPWETQRYRPEVWIEKDALLGVIEGVCTEWRVPHFACRGNNSETLQYQAGKRLERHLADGLTPLVLHLGDHDPNGLDMTRDNRERLALYSRHDVEVRRLALNMDQVERFAPPPNFAKETDSRYAAYVRQFGTTECWELDALNPTVVAELIRNEIERLVDHEAWNSALAEEVENRNTLTSASANWANVEKFLREEPPTPPPAA